MPDVTIAAPVAAHSVDRLNLGEAPARATTTGQPANAVYVCYCAADE